MAIVIKDEKGYVGKEISLDPFEQKILELLSKKKLTLSEVARELKISTQLANYYLNKKLKDYVIKEKQGKKIYYSAPKAFAIIVNEKADFYLTKIEEKDLHPFITENILNTIFVVGAPFPHGPFSASARDGHYIGYLLSYFGKFFKYTKFKEFVRLDVDVLKENLLKNNLVLVGGPVTNIIVYKLNTTMKVRFLQEYNWDVYSDFSSNRFSDEFVGIIANIRNPWENSKRILLFAGKRAIGTKIAIRYFISNKFNLNKDYYIILQGKDYDGDGYPESIDVLEKNYL